ncbi:uncharacterized protein CELE_Y65B4A.4 [Caenorhabditis elegans]|uniref:Uncharacterized protein n=1 Tax=Caenorhabditis elegans TaxID=6239 RepID=Q9BL63_CAEEL|nr:Uncharacterized protein CELE_Y65B4A.4 [Caenorhabditis elegans]CCD71922.1 Uncharacterized protein CELE_Y65B4A.4 [Caenorhabditis elegans]|eukprot:NP_490759.1 Uncharacterized protein CELE_Y65B4A.4 [Caenorhabditis elegans]
MDPSVVSRLENVANRMENILLKYDSNKKETPVGATPQIINLYDDAICENLVSFYDLSAKIGGDLNRLGCMTKNLFFTLFSMFFVDCVWAQKSGQRRVRDSCERFDDGNCCIFRFQGEKSKIRIL